MSLYSEITKYALASGLINPTEAWEFGKKQTEINQKGTESTRDKGCPKSAFISLAEHGYISGFNANPEKRLSENAQHVLIAYKVLNENPDITKKKAEWWRETAKRRMSSRQGQNGVLDVLIVLMSERRFQPNGGKNAQL